MYERSAIVLEKYYNNMFGFDKKINLKTIYKDYKEIIEEIQKYQSIIEEEDKVINEFDEAANEIRNIQQEQKKIYNSILKLEEDRNKLFDSLDEDPTSIEKSIKKIEENIEKNNIRLKELREKFINSLTKFIDKQKERNKYSRCRRTEEKSHLEIIEKSNKNMNEIDISILKDLKNYINSDDEVMQKDITEIMISNGKDERVPFNKDVIDNAVNMRNEIARREAECYLLIYERMKRILVEVNNDEIKLDKYKKVLRDVSVKLAFLKAQKIYIVSFLDNERMTAINGKKAHEQLMLDACEKFRLDMEQFNNLYELILREISGKATKKTYKELYDKEYLKNIEEKEKSFEKEVNSIQIKAGTIINSNYWRIDEIKNIYNVFQNEVSEKFEKDLSEFKLEEVEEVDNNIEEKIEKVEDDIFKSELDEDDVEYIEEYEYDDEEDDEYEDEYDDDEEDDEYEDEYDDDEEDDEYEDEYDDEENEDEYEDEYDDEEDEDEYEDEYDDEEDEDEYEDGYDDEEDGEEEYEVYKYKYDDEDEISNTKYHKSKQNRNNIKDNLKGQKQNKKGKGLFNKFFKD